jgi:ribosomal protein L20A (L18A)
MKYWVTYKVIARGVVDVEANSEQEALDKAYEDISNRDVNMVSDISDYEVVMVEDENGKVSEGSFII